LDPGYFILVLSLLVSAYATYSFYSGVKSRRKDLLAKAENAVYIYTALLTFAYLLLTYYFLARDFSLLYVYSYSDRHLSTLYTISAVWAGREGSLLLWALYLAIINSAILRFAKKDAVTALSLSISSFVVLFFNALLLTLSNPFQRLEFTPPDGIGLNPLLRTPEMALHPPTIFLGYAATTIPFAFAISAVYFREDWLRRSRFWILFSWLFLSIGIFLGAWWAYKTLGWGGYWAWDPVENASLLPWLTVSALIHGMMVEERRKGLGVWNYFLAIISFDLVILATFITRSGIISSVHAFGENPEGWLYLLLIVLSALIGVMLYNSRRDMFRGSFELSLNRETAIFVNILLLLLSTFTILLGTLAPLIGEDVQVTRQYYDRIEIPLGTALVILLGICAAINWRFDKGAFIKSGRIAVASGIVGFIIVFAATGLAVASVGAGIFAFSIITHLQNLKISDVRNPRKFGGYIVHVGIIILFLGVMGSWIYEESYKNVALELNQPKNVGGFTLLYRDNQMVDEHDKLVVTAIVEIYRGSELVGVCKPHLKVYKLQRQDRVVSSVEIISKPTHDIYIAASGFSEDLKRVFIELYVVPLISLVWVGSVVMMAGGSYAAFSKITREVELAKTARDVSRRPDGRRRPDEITDKTEVGGKKTRKKGKKRGKKG
jgi:cytochrome c-type biogenesis protein CcmF